MKTKEVQGHRILVSCGWKKSEECPDKDETNATERARAIAEGISIISHGICEACEKIMFAELD